MILAKEHIYVEYRNGSPVEWFLDLEAARKRVENWPGQSKIVRYSLDRLMDFTTPRPGEEEKES